MTATRTSPAVGAARPEYTPASPIDQKEKQMQNATYRKPSTRINPAEASNLARLGLTYDPDAPKFRAGDASPVTRRPADGTFRETRPAYTREEVAAIVKQGKDRPRALTMEEAETAAKNRAEYRMDRVWDEVDHDRRTRIYDRALTEDTPSRSTGLAG